MKSTPCPQTLVTKYFFCRETPKIKRKQPPKQQLFVDCFQKNLERDRGSEKSNFFHDFL